MLELLFHETGRGGARDTRRGRRPASRMKQRHLYVAASRAIPAGLLRLGLPPVLVTKCVGDPKVYLAAKSRVADCSTFRSRAITELSLNVFSA